MKRSRSSTTVAPEDEKIQGPSKAGGLTRSLSSFSANAGADGATEHAIAHRYLTPILASRGADLSGGYFVIGCDEAGRGPLAGPVVASACCVYVVPQVTPHSTFLPGLTDSKVVQEPHREILLHHLIDMISQTKNDEATSRSLREAIGAYYTSGGSSSAQVNAGRVQIFPTDSVSITLLPLTNDLCVFSDSKFVPSATIITPQLVAFASSVVSPQTIDSINILHASLRGMSICASRILSQLPTWWRGVHDSRPLPPVLLLCDGTQLPLEFLWGGDWDRWPLNDVLLTAPSEAEKPVVAEGKGTKATKSKAPKVELTPHGRRMKANPHLVASKEIMSCLSGGYCPPSVFALCGTASKGTLSTTLSSVKSWRAEYNGGASPPVSLSATTDEDKAAAAGANNTPLVSMPVIKGDALCPTIAAASILAKQLRDHHMRALDKVCPLFGLADHKGYPVPSHCEALEKYGPVQGLHRFSFAPVREAIQ